MSCLFLVTFQTSHKHQGGSICIILMKFYSDSCSLLEVIMWSFILYIPFYVSSVLNVVFSAYVHVFLW